MHNLGVAVVGTGFMGPTHVEALRRLGLHVTGILGSSPEKSQAAAQRLNLPRGYNSYEQLLADGEVDVVHLTTPNKLHFEQAGQALAAGKHVLCEKPLAMSADESAQLVKLAAESGKVTAVNYNLRFYPLNLEARERVRRGDLGAIHAVHGSYVQDWLLYPTDYNWRLLAGEGGALRAVADIGTHWLDLIDTITGLEVEAVMADLTTIHPRRQRPAGEVQTFAGKVQPQADGQTIETIDIETEDCAAILLRFKGGARGSLWVSQVTAGRKNSLRYEISGAESALAWDSEQPNELWVGHRNKANEILLRDPGLVSETAAKYITYPGGHNEGYDDTFKQCFIAFYEYIAAADFDAPRLFPTFEDGHKELLLCEAILKSHREQRWVAVE